MTPSSFQTFLSSRWFFIMGLALLFLLAAAFSKVVYRNYQTHQDIVALEGQVTTLEDNQKKLKDLDAFLQTDFFAEREARIKLGMQKKDEHAIVIQNDGRTESVAPEKAATPAEQKRQDVAQQQSNLARWWDYFFK